MHNGALRDINKNMFTVNFFIQKGMFFYFLAQKCNYFSLFIGKSNDLSRFVPVITVAVKESKIPGQVSKVRFGGENELPQ